MNFAILHQWRKTMNFTVLKSRALGAGPATQAAEIILCELPDNPYTRYVTWQRNIEDGGRYWGHYFNDVVEAYRDFENRGKGKS